MTGLESSLAKLAFAPGLGQRLLQGWQGMRPAAQHAIMGAGVGAAGTALGGSDASGETHYMRNMALGAGAGVGAGHVAGRMLSRAPAAPPRALLAQSVGHPLPGTYAAASAPPHPPAAPAGPPIFDADIVSPKVGAAYEAGKRAAFTRYSR